MKKRFLLLCLLMAAIGALPVAGHAYAVITSPIPESFQIVSGAAQSPAAFTSSDMVFGQYSADGWGWTGGAGGVQGSSSITNTGGTAVPANEVFGFTVGQTVAN